METRPNTPPRPQGACLAAAEAKPSLLPPGSQGAMGAKKREGQLPVSAVPLPSLRPRSAASSSSSAAAKQPEAPSESDQTQPPPPPLPSRPPAVAPGVAEGSRGRPGLACERSSGSSGGGGGVAMLGVFRSIPTQMDYKGQKLAEQIFQGIILFSAVIGFICGYITEQFGWTVYIVMAGFALSCLLTLPPWPIYRRNPLKWLPVQEVATDDKKPADRKVKRHPKN